MHVLKSPQGENKSAEYIEIKYCGQASRAFIFYFNVCKYIIFNVCICMNI